ncbi:MAG: flagellar basal body-associated FliL family protein [Fimbriimonadaceae bacterium]
MKGVGKKVKPEIKLAHGEKAIVEIEEKLYNLADRETYLRCTLALHPKEGYEATKIGANLQAIEDAILRTVSDKLPDEVLGSKNIQKLKVELTTVINTLLNEAEEPAEGEKPHSDESVESKDAKEAKHDKPKQPEEIKHPEWDSQTGPILKVYFRAFAIQ